jgi:DNA-binding LytR/AlgR family response regulator
MDTKVLIIEDEFPIALDIEQRLKKLGYEVVGIAGKYNYALTLLAEKEYDIVLLDINLDEKKNGIDLANIINEKFHCPVIFITAYSDKQTFTEAADAKPMGYIVKPFNDSELDRTINLSLMNFRNINKEKYTDNRIEYKPEVIFIKEKGVIKKVFPEEILWIEAMDNYTIINTEKERFIVNSFLKDVLEKLGERFVRIHRSHAVAINKIISIEENSLYIGNAVLSISQTYKNDLIERMKIL